MRCSWIKQSLLPVIAATLLVAAGATGAQEISALEQSALDHVESTTQAYGALGSGGDNDVDRYLGHYAKELTWWGPEGRSLGSYPESGNVDAWDDYHSWWTQYVENQGSVVSAEMTDAVAQVSESGDTAIVSYLLVADYRSADGSVSRSTFQMSTSMMMQDGGWKIVHLHYQSVPQDE